MAYQINDLKFEYMATALSLPVDGSYTINDLELLWLRSLTSKTGLETIQDLWIEYLAGLGYTTGSIQDRQSEWLKGLGYSGSLDDMFLSYWASAAVEASNLLDVASDNIVDVDSNQIQVY